MSMHTACHLYDDTTIEHQPSQRLADRGWLRILPIPGIPGLATVLYADAADFRRLAAACLDMADELDPAEVTA